jgi:rubrerythrin
MSFNPLEEKGIPLDRQLRNWRELNVQPYDTNSVDPYTRCRIITMNGAEMESMWFSHHFARHTTDIDLKRKLAESRRIEMQQQKAVNWLIPGNEDSLEVTIGYEQVAVDLTAALAQMEKDEYARQCYDFGLLEDFDHLYRYANLMDMQNPRKAADIVGQLTEIMPGRPTIVEHRHPHDEIRKPLRKDGDPMSILHAMTVTAAEQQTLNFYCNVGNRPEDPVARGLYLEIAQIEEQHVSHYESMLPADATWAEMLVLHDYNECWLYWSFAQTETDPNIRKLWELHLAMEIEQLRQSCELMKQIDGRDPAELLPKSLDYVLEFKSNKEYVRKVLKEQVHLTGDGTGFVPVSSLPEDHRYFWYQDQVNVNGSSPSEEIINRHRESKGEEYRLQTEGPHPVDHLQAAE